MFIEEIAKHYRKESKVTTALGFAISQDFFIKKYGFCNCMPSVFTMLVTSWKLEIKEFCQTKKPGTVITFDFLKYQSSMCSAKYWQQLIV